MNEGWTDLVESLIERRLSAQDAQPRLELLSSQIRAASPFTLGHRASGSDPGPIAAQLHPTRVEANPSLARRLRLSDPGPSSAVTASQQDHALPDNEAWMDYLVTSLDRRLNDQDAERVRGMSRSGHLRDDLAWMTHLDMGLRRRIVGQDAVARARTLPHLRPLRSFFDDKELAGWLAALNTHADTGVEPNSPLTATAPSPEEPLTPTPTFGPDDEESQKEEIATWLSIMLELCAEDDAPGPSRNGSTNDLHHFRVGSPDSEAWPRWERDERGHFVPPTLEIDAVSANSWRIIDSAVDSWTGECVVRSSNAAGEAQSDGQVLDSIFEDSTEDGLTEYNEDLVSSGPRSKGGGGIRMPTISSLRSRFSK